ncbi:MAG: type II toxin-antitoxin system RelE/ParE family toxin [Chthoniobacteraceae bacterium]
MRYEFHPQALDEYEAAARYYAGVQTGLEVRFITCVESAFRQVSEASTRWRLFEEDVRRCLVHVFPYAVLYSIESDYILIIAVMHCSRGPDYWHHRIEGSVENPE